jgi:hypothetical protein
VVSLLAIHLMAKHRLAEIVDSEWLEKYERRHFGYSLHGANRLKFKNQVRAKMGPLGFLAKTAVSTVEIWSTGILAFPVHAAFPSQGLYIYIPAALVLLISHEIQIRWFS